MADRMQLASLSPEQLQNLGEQLEQDVSQLTESLSSLQKAVGRYHTSGRALEAMQKETMGKDMLVPLTSSLYVPGKLGDVTKVLIDVGTGYYLEQSPADGVDYSRRKVMLLKDNMEKLLEVITQKRKQTAQVQQAYQLKVQAMEQQQAKANDVGA
uniref:Prefoldin subunit 5 n=1 Tax=Mantoniella antarctica TaxID=81844 RepID=A0A7S0SL79_9CHLO